MDDFASGTRKMIGTILEVCKVAGGGGTVVAVIGKTYKVWKTGISFQSFRCKEERFL